MMAYFIAIWNCFFPLGIGILWSFGVFCGHMVYFMVLCYILWSFGIFLAIRCILWSFGIVRGHLV
jgi:hypothetical protein